MSDSWGGPVVQNAKGLWTCVAACSSVKVQGYSNKGCSILGSISSHRLSPDLSPDWVSTPATGQALILKCYHRSNPIPLLARALTQGGSLTSADLSPRLRCMQAWCRLLWTLIPQCLCGMRICLESQIPLQWLICPMSAPLPCALPLLIAPCPF